MHPDATASGAPVQAESLKDVIDQVIDAAQADHISLRQILAQIGDASFAPILLLPALAVATPLSGIPFFSSLMGIIISLVSIQMLIRKDHIWFPDWVLRREAKGSRVQKAFHALYPAANWIDARTRRRFTLFVKRPLIVLPQLVCLLSGALMPLLEFVPFSSSIMGMGVALLALGMLARDGVVILLGLIPYGGVGWLIYLAIF